MTKIQPHQIAVVAEYHQYGRRFDDGQPVIGDCYFLVYETDQGYRWRHNHRFHGILVDTTSDDDAHYEGPCYLNMHDQARAAAERLAERVRCRGSIDLEYWQEDRPAYASLAWIESNQDQKELFLEYMEDQNEY